MIFRGAPGTGKTYLAKQIAADIISDGEFDDYERLTDEQKKQVEFVQFHPNYDYSDFVEGFRPKLNADGTMGFELRDGIFKKFVAHARKNYEEARRNYEFSRKVMRNSLTEISAQESLMEFFSNIEFGKTNFETIRHSKFSVTSVDERYINVFIPENPKNKKIKLKLDDIRKMLDSDKKLETVRDLRNFFRKKHNTHEHSYYLAIYKEIMKLKKSVLETKTDVNSAPGADKNIFSLLMRLIAERFQKYLASCSLRWIPVIVVKLEKFLHSIQIYILIRKRNSTYRKMCTSLAL